MYDDRFLQKKLTARRNDNAFRELRYRSNLVDFCSNDYLGIIKNNLLRNREHEHLAAGSGGSRLIAGNYALIETVENEIALFHDAEAAIIFNSGYDANLGVLSSVPQRGDTVLYDYLSHASIRDGIRLSLAQSYAFPHNDMDALEKKLRQVVAENDKNIFIVTESVFSMDGDTCPLPQLVELSEKYHAHLVVDEAHATGVIGAKGEGLVQQQGLQKAIFCRIHTFGKACGCHGAVILGSKALRDHCINFARSFIYSTSLPEQAVANISSSYKVFPFMQKERSHLDQLVQLIQEAPLAYERLTSSTSIQGVVIPGNAAVKAKARELQDQGFDVRPILYPTVPAGQERLRIVLHAFNTEEQLRQLISCLSMI